VADDAALVETERGLIDGPGDDDRYHGACAIFAEQLVHDLQEQ
jgi:hypothetical protein